MDNFITKKKAEDSIEYNVFDNYFIEKVTNDSLERRFEKLKSEIDVALKKWKKYKSKFYGGFKNG